jgi:hypothetical protein
MSWYQVSGDECRDVDANAIDMYVKKYRKDWLTKAHTIIFYFKKNGKKNHSVFCKVGKIIPDIDHTKASLNGLRFVKLTCDMHLTVASGNILLGVFVPFWETDEACHEAAPFAVPDSIRIGGLESII